MGKEFKVGDSVLVKGKIVSKTEREGGKTTFTMRVDDNFWNSLIIRPEDIVESPEKGVS